MGLRFGAKIGAASLFACSCLLMPRSTVGAACPNAPHSNLDRAGPGADAHDAAGSVERPQIGASTVADETHNRLDAAATDAAIVGMATMYNPFRPDDPADGMEGGTETASGEPYDPAAWTAAIRTDLRDKFGGVRFGKDYRPAYALVEGTGKRAIVRINDVGPLLPGRIIDFNEQTMRYFDPTLELGIIRPVKVTPLPGDDWTPGPLAGNG